MHLITKTTAQDGDFEMAAVHIPPDIARRLSRYKKLIEPLKAHDESFFCIEFFDTTCEFGGYVENYGTPEGDIEWLMTPTDPALDVGQTTSDMLHVMEKGIFWSASPKHGEDAHFETPPILWEQLETLTKGESPFPEHVNEDP